MEKAGQFIQKTLLAWLVVFSAIALFLPDGGLDPFLWTADVKLPDVKFLSVNLPGSISSEMLTGTGRALLGFMIQFTMFCIGCLISVEEINEVFRRWPLVLGGTGHRDLRGEHADVGRGRRHDHHQARNMGIPGLQRL